MSEAQYLERVAVDALGKGLYVAEPDRERFSAAVQSVAEDRSAARDLPTRALEDARPGRGVDTCEAQQAVGELAAEVSASARCGQAVVAAG